MVLPIGQTVAADADHDSSRRPSSRSRGQRSRASRSRRSDPGASGWRGSWRRALAVAVAVGLAYAAGSEMAYAWFDANGANASFFPAAGVTIAALVSLDLRWWPSVAVGAGTAEILVDLSHELTLGVSIGYAGANLGQAFIGGLALGRWRRRLDLAKLRHLAAFVTGAVLVAPMVGGALGASVHTWIAGADGWWRFAAEWWVGDGLGVLVVGGTLLGLQASTTRGAVPAGVIERALLAGVAVGATFLTFRFDLFALVYVPFALVFVIAIRAGTRDVAVVGALVAFVAAEGTARGHRFWDTLAIDDSTGLLYLQLALAVVIASALVMAAALAEREGSTLARSRAEAAQREAVLGRERAEALERQAARLARLSDALDRSTTAEERARHVVDELSALGASAAAVELRTEDDHVVLAAVGSTAELSAPDQVIALQARGRVLGRLVVAGAGRLTGGRGLLPAIATRAAIAIDNALLYERERDVSHRLQLGLLDVSFPRIDGLVIDASYRPGTATLDIGGDWHDAFVLPSGAVALVVGDVVGHGLDAAIAMAQLRGAVRALAADSSPSELLDRLDVFVDSLPAADMATLVYIELDPSTGRFRYACAGHPPPLIVSATGVSRLLWGARSTPLGSQFGSRRIESIDVLADAERLVLYTDGLVERRRESLDVGFARLLATTAHDVASIDFVDRVQTRMLDGILQRDDVCLLTATRMDGTSYARSLTGHAAELRSLRRELRQWLAQWTAVDGELDDVLLAVSEAVSNAVEHGASGDPDQPVVVVATLAPRDASGSDPSTSADVVHITVRDHGVWHEPTVSVDRGRGLVIMRALMDEVVVERHDDGTVVRLARVLRGCRSG